MVRGVETRRSVINLARQMGKPKALKKIPAATIVVRPTTKTSNSLEEHLKIPRQLQMVTVITDRMAPVVHPIPMVMGEMGDQAAVVVVVVAAVVITAAAAIAAVVITAAVKRTKLISQQNLTI
jgi:hypothetical protein